MKVKDLVKGQIYALQCPMNNYALKPFVFDRIEPNKSVSYVYHCHFFGIESPNLIYPISVLLNGTEMLDYGCINATPLTPLEVELL